MSDNLRPRDPLDPRPDPAGIDPLAPGEPLPPHEQPRTVQYTDARGGSGAGIVVAAVLAVLLVIGFIAFTGEGVDPETTATVPGPAATDEVVPPAASPQPAPAPAPAQEAEPPAAAPEAEPAPVE